MTGPRSDEVLALIRKLTPQDYTKVKSGIVKIDAEAHANASRMATELAEQAKRMEKFVALVAAETNPAPQAIVQAVQPSKTAVLKKAKLAAKATRKRLRARGAKTGVKYRSENGKDSWSGRGPKPKWLVEAMKASNKPLDAFRI